MKNSFEAISVQPIGVIESCYPDKFGTPRQPGLVSEARGRIRFRADVQPEQALEGLDRYSHVWVLFYFHLNTNQRYHAKVHPPRLGGETMGVFATRSPHRPNPIGLSLIEIEKIEGEFLYLKGLDLVDGTPVLDIKPYLPQVEALASAQAGWTHDVPEKSISVRWTLAAEADFLDWTQTSTNEWMQRQQAQAVRSLIESTLKLDPRPVVYRGYENQESPYRNEHAVRIYDGDVHFHFTSANEIEVLKILFKT